jgi:hypothetical protein
MRTLTRWLRPSRSEVVTFCEACGQVCTAACRAATRLDRARTTALRRRRPR